jgi:hypothetical protein
VATITLPDGSIKTKWLPSIKEAGQMLLTFALAVIGWIIFRATDIHNIGTYIYSVCEISTLLVLPIKKMLLLKCISMILLMLLVEWFNRCQDHALSKLPSNPIVRIVIYYGIFLLIFLLTGKNETFIYFQF